MTIRDQMSTLFESSIASQRQDAIAGIVVVDYDDLIQSHHQALLDEYDIIATLSEAEANWS